VKQDILELAASLAREGEPFVLATVVWSRAPSSGKPGSTALITGDGRIHGWLGGACAEPTVIREGLAALAEGAPKLLFLGTPDELEGHRRHGVLTVPIACQSEGALEVYVEPVVPAPQLVVVGRSPAVDALAGMAGALGWRSVVVDDGGRAEDHPGADRVLTELDLSGVDDRSFVIVATQGHYDEDALARVHAPAGLDLGRLPNAEIAAAIVAELVQLRASGELAGGVSPAAVTTTHEEIDPVCGMGVDVATARFRTTSEGRTFYFCSAACLARFTNDPAAFETSTP
jgi:xanthine dehydrogenase accessory factor